MFNWLKEKVVAWAVSAALVIWGLEAIAPPIIDMFLDALGVFLVYIVYWVSKMK